MSSAIHRTKAGAEMPRDLRRLSLAAIVAVSLAAVALPASAVAASGSSDRCGDSNCTMEQTIVLDAPREEITLPFYRGMSPQGPVEYIVTESSSKEDAERRGVNHSQKLNNARNTGAVQRVSVVNGVVQFPGGVFFNPNMTDKLRAGPDGMPPGAPQNPASGDANYSPLIQLPNGIVLNATHVRNPTGFHDSFVSDRQGTTFRPSDDPNAPRPAGEVTMSLFLGFWNGSDEIYLHTEASSRDVAMVEGSTHAPRLDQAPGLASNDPDTSARSAIIPIENGIEPRGNEDRQGLNSYLGNQGDPLNVTQTFPGKQDDRYSNVWDVHMVRWTEEAIARGERRRLESTSDVIGEFQKGNLEDTGTGPPNESLGGIRANNAISDCPIVADLPGVDPGERGEPGRRP